MAARKLLWKPPEAKRVHRSTHPPVSAETAIAMTHELLDKKAEIADKYFQVSAPWNYQLLKHRDAIVEHFQRLGIAIIIVVDSNRSIPDLFGKIMCFLCTKKL
jgi:hypothetical protein